METDWLIVGLGNPGPQYESTWHNLGFLTVAQMEKDLHFSCDRQRFQGLYGQTRLQGARQHFLLPMTYMNDSGRSVAEAARFFKIPSENILVIVDDFEIPLGTLRLREQGSPGTHNGLKSITQWLGTNHYPRVRIGYGPLPPERSVVDFVLQQIPLEQREVVKTSLARASQAVQVIWEEGVARAMNRFNGKGQPQ